MVEPGGVSSSCTDTERVVSRNSMLSVSIIIIWFKKLWVIGRSGQLNNRVYRSNINGNWNQIRGVPGYFVWAGTITNGNGR